MTEDTLLSANIRNSGVPDDPYQTRSLGERYPKGMKNGERRWKGRYKRDQAHVEQVLRAILECYINEK